MLKKLLGEEKGSVIIMVTIALVVLIGFTGLVIDGGSAYLTKSRLQNAADAGALAGVTVSSDDSETEARNYTKLNEVEHGVNGTTVIAEYIAAAGTETTEEAYTEDEIEEMKADLEAELNDMGDQDVIAAADGYKVDISSYTEGSGDSRIFKTVTTKTLEQIVDEERALLETWSDLDLMNEAKQYGVYSMSWTSDNVTFKTNKDYKGTCIKAILETSAYQDRFAAESSTNYRALVIQEIVKEIDALKNEKIVMTPGNLDRLKVTCTRTVQNSFMSVLGFKNTTVSAFAVAENSSWAGDALPFINLDGYPSTEGEELEAWNKVGPGDKERISNDDLIVSPHRIQVDISDEKITFKKGKVMSKIKDPLQNIVVVGKTVYLFSIKNSEVNNYKKKADKELKNGHEIDLEDIVLLECIVTEEWDGTGSDVISLKFVKAYDWDENVFKSAAGDKPGGGPRLVE